MYYTRLKIQVVKLLTYNVRYLRCQQCYTLFTIQHDTYLQCEILRLGVILHSTYNTTLTVRTYNVRYYTLPFTYIQKRAATCFTYNTDYIRYKCRK